MKGPEDKPLFETHCYSCGGELITKKAEKKRLGGIFSRRWQWHIDTVCSGCGREAASAIARYTYPRPGLMKRSLSPFQELIRNISPRYRPLRRGMSEYRGPDGNMDLARLLAAISFKAYGMKGHTLGLRLTSPGYGRTGEVIDRLHFQYITGGLQSGNRAPGERIIDIEQGPGSHRYGDPEADLFSIRGLVDSDREATVRVNGTDAMAELASWDEPQQVTLAHVNIGDHQMRVTSLNLSEEKLLQSLQTLTVLQEDQSALTQHIQDYKRASQELRAYWSARVAESPK